MTNWNAAAGELHPSFLPVPLRSDAAIGSHYDEVAIVVDRAADVPGRNRGAGAAFEDQRRAAQTMAWLQEQSLVTRVRQSLP